MAFPGKYDFSYYKGDTLQFNIYPKTSNGEAFDLTSFDNVVFTAAQFLGATGDDLINLVATFAPDRSYINCKIPPSTGLSFTAGTPYLYDIQINDGVDIVYTLLTGTISITEQISPNPVAPEPVLPSPPTGLTATQGILNDKISITLNWIAPTTGPTPTGYKISVSVPNPIPGGDPIEVPVATLGNVLTYTANSVTIPGVGTFDILPGAYTAKVTTVAASGDSATSATDAITILGPVTSLIISDRQLTTATVTWTAPEGPAITGYVAAINDNPQLSDTIDDFVPIQTVIAGNAVTYTFTNLTAMTPYAFAIVPLNNTDAGMPEFVVDGA